MKQHKLIQIFVLSLLVCLSLFLPAEAVRGQTDIPTDDDVNRIAKQLYCPVCENVPLDECTTEACQQWRDLIRQQLSDGWTEDEILAYFVAQFGDKVLGEPPRRGLNWVLYLIPPLVILTGIILLINRLRRPKVDSTNVEESDPYLLQIEQDLNERE
ncbi:MAG: cytochrome c-type biogenesis protein CcmH [Brevefilum sp.]|nr:cytochrome c-type biogenesis protein CcmH [Brevefilum sp.]